MNNKKIAREVGRSAEVGEKKKAVSAFRKDARILSYIKRIKENEIVLNKTNIAMLGPWGFKMLEFVIPRENFLTISQGVGMIRGKSISKETFIKIFENSAAFRRLAEMNYGKS